MNCPECGRPLAKYDETRVACKGGHVWTPPEYADKLTGTVVDGTRSLPLKPSRRRDRVPSWLPGVVLGGVAAAAQLVQLLT